jgi:hypothetical protein
MEVLLSIIMMNFVVFTFGYILNMIASICQEFLKKENQIKENMYIINKYMRIKKIKNKKLCH